MQLTKTRRYNRQPNIITRSADQMTLIEKRILYLIINRMDTGMNVQEDLFSNREFTITFKETGESNYKRIKESVTKLQDRKIVLIDDFKNKKFTSIIPFPYVKIDKGFITLKMLGDVVPYFLELKNGFTKYELEAALSLTSVYSQKMYELLSRWKDKKKWEVELDELKVLLNAENYNRFPDFRRTCLDKPLEEIAAKTDLKANYELIKEGKKFIGLVFRIKSTIDEAKEEHSVDMGEFVKLTNEQKYIYVSRLMNDYNFSKRQVNEIMSKPTLFNKFVDLESKIQTGVLKDIKNPTAYLAKAIFEY